MRKRYSSKKINIPDVNTPTAFTEQFPKCPDKRTYETCEEAEMVASFNTNRSGRKLTAYQCDVCGFFHLTSR